MGASLAAKYLQGMSVKLSSCRTPNLQSLTPSFFQVMLKNLISWFMFVRLELELTVTIHALTQMRWPSWWHPKQLCNLHQHSCCLLEWRMTKIIKNLIKIVCQWNILNQPRNLTKLYHTFRFFSSNHDITSGSVAVCLIEMWHFYFTANLSIVISI